MDPAGEGSETLTTRGRARLRGSPFLASAASPRGNHRTSAVTSNGQWRVLQNTTRGKKSRHGERCTKGAGRPETVCVVVAPKAWCMSPGPKANISPTHQTEWPCDQREGASLHLPYLVTRARKMVRRARSQVRKDGDRLTTVLGGSLDRTVCGASTRAEIAPARLMVCYGRIVRDATVDCSNNTSSKDSRNCVLRIFLRDQVFINQPTNQHRPSNLSSQLVLDTTVARPMFSAVYNATNIKPISREVAHLCSIFKHHK